MNCKGVATLIEAGALNLIVSNPGQATKQEVEAYQSIMGSLTYLIDVHDTITKKTKKDVDEVYNPMLWTYGNHEKLDV